MALPYLKRSTIFTDYLTPDSKVPTVLSSKKASDDLLRVARYVDGIFTWIRPEQREEYHLMAMSPATIASLGLSDSVQKDPLFQDVVMGKTVLEDTYPWSQNYAGWQFGQFAGQLGDGRAISLFEVTNELVNKRYELQLKGAGLTPYSRFADGKAVLRSSIREFLGSEALNALGVPTTRALSIAHLPKTIARRETRETCAVVCRVAETWIRIGTFDNIRLRRSRSDMRKLADFCINQVFGGEKNLRGHGNRYRKLFTETTLRTAYTVGLWQSYGFMNGVLNTDNTSIYGLSLDFGPFAFMESFDKRFTPNHDDGTLRYSYENNPRVMWWNLIKFGEDIGEFLGQEDVDDPEYIKSGVREKDIEKVTSSAGDFIVSVGDLYHEEMEKVYCETMIKRLGLRSVKSTDKKTVIEPLLNVLQESRLDYNLFFRRLGRYRLGDRDCSLFMQADRGNFSLMSDEELKKALCEWLNVYDARVHEDFPEISEQTLADRSRNMNSVNPNFVLRTWIMDRVIQKCQVHDYSLLEKVLHMSLFPFKESWGFDESLEKEFVGEPPTFDRDIQCSCSS